MDAALVRHLSVLELKTCRLVPASVPALVRLLGGNALVELNISSTAEAAGLLLLEQLLDDTPAAALLSDALRANTSLTALRLSCCGVWNHPAAAAVLSAALAGHPRLRAIDLSDNRNPRLGAAAAAEVSAALGALVAANEPALQQLNVSNSALVDKEMGLLVDALRHNTHLTKLDCSINGMSEAFARDRLLPAVRANTSLRTLVALPFLGGVAGREAEELVAARTRPPT